MDNEVREFDFCREDFEQVRALLYEVAGIKLTDNKDSMVYSRLARRLRALRITSFSEYMRFLKTNGDELEHFINGLTTNLTAFFRENHHFETLHEYFRHARGHQRIWCAASSTGEEPYSIAMCAAEAYGTLSPPVEILATDIDSNVLATASAGIYPETRVTDMRSDRLKRFFHKGKGSNAGKVRVVPELQQLITYKRLNLTEPQWPHIKGPFDIVFCRNVMIYFDKETQKRVLRKLAGLITEGGLYFAGHSESILNATDILRSVGKTVYRKVGQHD